MKKMIEALSILDKYNCQKYPLFGVDKSIRIFVMPSSVSDSDRERVGKLGFTEESDCFEVYLYKADCD